MKYLVTGFPGTGKSAVSDELERRGYKSYSTDDLPGFSYFIERNTKEPVDKPTNAPGDWNLNHDWIWKPEKIKRVLAQAADVFICGISPTQTEYYDQFDKIFLLVLDEKNLIGRLKARSSNDFGKRPEELNYILDNYRKFEGQLAKNHNPIIIDASQSLKQVVDEILSYVHEN